MDTKENEKNAKSEPNTRLTHGVYSWLRTGKVNPSIRGQKKLQKYLQDIEKELIDDLGGVENLTAAKEILIKGTIEAYGVLFLAMMYCKKTSILRPDKLRRGIVEMQPVLGAQFLAYMNTIRQNLLALQGLENNTEKLSTPEKIAAEIIEERDNGK
ncbi:MAG: hypothetical protein HQ555_07765 [Candidatus Aminicenantes bacterium]|nr:hypothetical protein [Candidatus Aminicenantes bacterium]